uniref:1-acyl-sn-glycerol-3-phosphate acyltransferase n=1 Tax=Romanomermis culicivorax TaxID=13658 RepID=A0A915KQE4_ROMCU
MPEAKNNLPDAGCRVKLKRQTSRSNSRTGEVVQRNVPLLAILPEGTNYGGHWKDEAIARIYPRIIQILWIPSLWT